VFVLLVQHLAKARPWIVDFCYLGELLYFIMESQIQSLHACGAHPRALSA
jgi:hypothetical protein